MATVKLGLLSLSFALQSEYLKEDLVVIECIAVRSQYVSRPNSKFMQTHQKKFLIL